MAPKGVGVTVPRGELKMMKEKKYTIGRVDFTGRKEEKPTFWRSGSA